MAIKKFFSARVYEFTDEISLFLEYLRKHDLPMSFTSEGFQLALAYLADIFEALDPTRSTIAREE